MEIEEELVCVQGRDGEKDFFPVKHVSKSSTLKNLMEDVGQDAVLPLPSVTLPIFRLAMEWVERISRVPSDESPRDSHLLTRWETDFMIKIGPEAWPLIEAVNYLDIFGLLVLLCKAEAQTVATECKTAKDIETHFGIQSQTEDDARQLVAEMPWIEEIEPIPIQSKKSKNKRQK